MNLKRKAIIMNPEEVRRAIVRISHEIVEAIHELEAGA